ncbi:nad dependent epimerase dehydratase family protein [Colletotrichum plurivorum]|uniref:Nad dependent epimerase dehydratase family protein n=1 Tax=Colletotrichum plurivorum TaxID=2175906 RepID=A0A8H6N240_9PEZI|nr:nad dependent epimerase dehydratase family protein [Colletotrichum plurivorum]
MSTSLVFITGASGFIGAHITALTLRAGHRVRLSVRKEEQIPKLRAVFAEFTADADKNIEFVLVPDFTKADAFGTAVAGVDYVVHVASPMVGKGADFQRDYIDPAVQGTTSVLDAAKASPSIKRVLVMSSILALLPIGVLTGAVTSPIVARENSETKLVVDVNMPLDDGIAGHTDKYQGSKILAHQATSDWVSANKPSFPVLTFHPSFVTGPSLFQKKPEEIDSINHLLLSALRTGAPGIPAIFVDVRDVALAFANALKAEDVPAFQEFILTGPAVPWDEVAASAQSLYPNAGFNLKPPVAGPLGGPPLVTAVTTAAEKILGIKWKSLEEVIRGLVDVQLAIESGNPPASVI